MQIFMGGKYLSAWYQYIICSHITLGTYHNFWESDFGTLVEQVWRRGMSISQYKSKCYYGEHVESQPVLFPSLENTKPDILLENSWLSVI